MTEQTRIRRTIETKAKAVARQCLPPIVYSAIRRAAGGSSVMEYAGQEWPSDSLTSPGWNEAAVANQLHDWWDTYVRGVKGSGPIGFAPWEPGARSEAYHNVVLTFAYVLGRAGHGNQRLSILDYGGCLGHYAVIAKAMLPEMSFDYTVKEVDSLCQVGSKLLPDISFTASDDECFSRHYDLVMASNSMQYIEDWKATLRRLREATDKWLLITCLETVSRTPRFVVVHRPFQYGAQTRFWSWVFNRSEFLAHMKGLDVILDREFLAGGKQRYKNAPEDSERVGFLFRVRH
jgi:putative methyltransferase (TIGR04325 family)